MKINLGKHNLDVIGEVYWKPPQLYYVDYKENPYDDIDNLKWTLIKSINCVNYRAGNNNYEGFCCIINGKIVNYYDTADKIDMNNDRHVECMRYSDKYYGAFSTPSKHKNVYVRGDIKARISANCKMVQFEYYEENHVNDSRKNMFDNIGGIETAIFSIAIIERLPFILNAMKKMTGLRHAIFTEFIDGKIKPITIKHDTLETLILPCAGNCIIDMPKLRRLYLINRDYPREIKNVAHDCTVHIIPYKSFTNIRYTIMPKNKIIQIYCSHELHNMFNNGLNLCNPENVVFTKRLCNMFHLEYTMHTISSYVDTVRSVTGKIVRVYTPYIRDRGETRKTLRVPDSNDKFQQLIVSNNEITNPRIVETPTQHHATFCRRTKSEQVCMILNDYRISANCKMLQVDYTKIDINMIDNPAGIETLIVTNRRNHSLFEKLTGLQHAIIDIDNFYKVYENNSIKTLIIKSKCPYKIKCPNLRDLYIYGHVPDNINEINCMAHIMPLNA